MQRLFIISRKRGNLSELHDLTAVIRSEVDNLKKEIDSVEPLLAKHIDNDMPTGASWHRSLLNRMAESSDVRNAVIDEAFRDRLSEYLGFRHFYRHAYSMSLTWDRLQPLVKTLEQTHQELQEAITRFVSESNDRADRKDLSAEQRVGTGDDADLSNP